MNQRFQCEGRQVLMPGGEMMAEATTEEAAQQIVDALNERRAIEIERMLTRAERTLRDPNTHRVSSAEMRRIMTAKGVDISQLPPLSESTPETVAELVHAG